MSTPVIQISGVSRNFGRQQVLDDLNLTVESGQTFAFLGRNGAGKTTIFRMIMEEETPDKGSFTIGDTAKIAYVDQSHSNIDPDKSIWENFSELYF